MNSTTISILITGLLIAGAIYLGGKSPNEESAAQNVRVENGAQIITITAKGGYSPRVSSAKAGLPSILRIKTNGTFDCSAALAIPALNYRTNLSSSGTIDVPVPPQQTGTALEGLCAMGMYHFRVNFE